MSDTTARDEYTDEGIEDAAGQEMSILVRVNENDVDLLKYRFGSWKMVFLNGSSFCDEELNEFLAHPCCAALTHLFLNETDLYAVPPATMELYELRVLEMSGNNIAHLPKGLASQLVQLVRLDVSRNEICNAQEFLELYENLGCTFKVDLSYNYMCGLPPLRTLVTRQNPVEDDCALLMPSGTPYPFPADARGDVREQIHAEYSRLAESGSDLYALLVAFSVQPWCDLARPGYFGSLLLVGVQQEEHLEGVARNLLARGCLVHSALLLPYRDDDTDSGLDYEH